MKLNNISRNGPKSWIWIFLGILLLVKVCPAATFLEGLKKTSVILENGGSQNFVSAAEIIEQKPFTLVMYGASWCGYCRSEVVPVTKLLNEFPKELTVGA